jgi:hypothetical protein
MQLIREIIKRFLFLLNILLAVYTLLVYQLSYSVSVKHWLAGFFMMSMPFVLLANGIFMLIWAIRLSPRAFLSLALLLIGFPFLLRTVTWHNINNRGHYNNAFICYVDGTTHNGIKLFFHDGLPKIDCVDSLAQNNKQRN